MAIKVSGTCQPEKCGNACCKGWDSNPSQLELSNVIGLKPDGWVCDHLDKDGRCKIYANRPECCKNFPAKNDGLFKICKSLGCTFEITEERE